MEELIIEKAQWSFMTYGPRMVTMDDIASSAGVSKKTLYQYFPSKEDLLEKVHASIFHHILFLMQSVRKRGLNPIEELIVLHEEIFAFLKSDNEVFMHQMMVYYPAVYHKMKEEIYTAVRSCIGDNFQRGVKDGLYEDVIDGELVVNFFLAINLAIKEAVLFEACCQSRREIERAHLLFHLRSLASEKGRLIIKQMI